MKIGYPTYFILFSEAPLLIRPFLDDMTRSEMHAVMTSGMATVAGSTLGAYINFGVKASHLLCASIMSAPAALAMSKVFTLSCRRHEILSVAYLIVDFLG